MHFKGNLSEHPESRISLHENWNHCGEGIFTCMTSRTSDDFTYAPCFSDGCRHSSERGLRYSKAITSLLSMRLINNKFNGDIVRSRF